MSKSLKSKNKKVSHSLKPLIPWLRGDQMLTILCVHPQILDSSLNSISRIGSKQKDISVLVPALSSGYQDLILQTCNP